MMDNKKYLEEIYAKQKEVATSKKKDEFYKIKFKKTKANPLKMVATFVLAIGVTVGIGYAGTVTYQNIWKEPETYKLSQKVTDEDKKESISEEEAEKLGNEYLKKVGLDDEFIQNLQLSKEFLSDQNEWDMSSQKATIRIDGKTGDLKSIQIPTWNYRIPYNYGITREEARVVAKELFEKYKMENITGEYQLVKLTRNMETDEGSYIWYADFYKKYGDLLNEYEKVSIGWVPTINGLYSLNIERNKYENNSQEITREKAIEIAQNKDEQIEQNKSIKNIEADIRIEKMNANAYLREKYKEQFERGEFSGYKDIQYKTEERVRKVWSVTINYNVTSQDDRVDSFTYFVDATTGEIIGGARYSPVEKEKNLQEDPYNLIEK